MSPVRSFGVLLPAALLLLGLLAPAALSAQWSDREAALLNPDSQSPFARVAEAVMPAVVSITSRKTFTHGEVDEDNPLEEMFRFYPRSREFMHREFEMPGAGSGFVVTEDGYVLTNNHVVAGASEIEVLLPGDEEPLVAVVVGQDPSTDLAVLKIDVGDRKLSHLPFGDSDAVRVGDWAIAIGNPLGQLAGSLTVGVISAKGRRDLNIQGGSPRYQDFLQTDAAINFGNSGGPLVDIHGRVIGINTAINASGQNIGFTIPVNLASRIYRQLREHGRVIRGYLGVRMQTLTAERSLGLDLDIQHGVLVTEVLPNTPADRGGITRGDIIVQFNGEPIHDDRDLSFKVADTPVGSTAKVKVHRDGRDRIVEVILAEYQEDAALASASPESSRSAPEESWLGIVADSLRDGRDPRAEELRETYGIEEDQGVLVLEVAEGSPADRARLRPGDVIVEIVNSPINDLSDFENAARRYRERVKPIAMLIRRGDITSYLTIDPLDDRGRDEKE